MRRIFIPFLALVAVLGGTTGCQHVKPWQRGGLADPIMMLDRDPLGAAEDEHVFFSREAAAGGRAVGGGGCGCN
jgi:hypothetical protein